MALRIQFSFGIKPTAHVCSCNHCKRPIKKNQERFGIQAWGWRQSATMFYHASCFLKVVKGMMIGCKKKDRWLEGVYFGIRIMEP